MKEVIFGKEAYEHGNFYPFSVFPECRILYAGPMACVRHDILAGIQLWDNMAYLCLEEVDVILGSYYKKIEEAVQNLIQKGNVHIIVLVMSCQSAIMGTAYERFIHTLEKRYNIYVEALEINRLNKFKKTSDRPVNSLTKSDMVSSLFCKIKKQKIDLLDASASRISEKTVNIMSRRLTRKMEGSIVDNFVDHDYRLLQIGDCQSMDDLEAMTTAGCNLILNEEEHEMARRIEREIKIPWMDLSFDGAMYTFARQYDEINRCFHLNLSFEKDYVKFVKVIDYLKEKLGQRSIVIDGRKLEHPFAIARLFLDEGIKVANIEWSEVNPEEKSAKLWLQTYYPDIRQEFVSIRRPRKRNGDEGKDKFVRLIHEKAFSIPKARLGFDNVWPILEDLNKALDG